MHGEVAAVDAEERVVIVVGDAARPQEPGHRGERRFGSLDVLEDLVRHDGVETTRRLTGGRDVVLDEIDGARLGAGHRPRPLAKPRKGSLLRLDIGDKLGLVDGARPLDHIEPGQVRCHHLRPGTFASWNASAPS